MKRLVIGLFLVGCGSNMPPPMDAVPEVNSSVQSDEVHGDVQPSGITISGADFDARSAPLEKIYVREPPQQAPLSMRQERPIDFYGQATSSHGEFTFIAPPSTASALTTSPATLSPVMGGSPETKIGGIL